MRMKLHYLEEKKVRKQIDSEGRIRNILQNKTFKDISAIEVNYISK